MNRWRLIVVIVIVSSLIGITSGTSPHAPAQSAPGTVQVLASSGNPGSFTAPIAIGRCRYANASFDYRTSVEIPGVTASPFPGHDEQRIDWEPRLYQVAATWPNDQILRTGPIQDETIASGNAVFATTSLSDLPQGPAYITGGRLSWHDDEIELGSIEFVFLHHDSFRETTIRFARNLNSCVPIAPATVALSTYRTTVNVTVHLAGRYFPVSAPVSVTWKGKSIAQAMSDAEGNVTASIRVPATPLGDYQLGLDAGGFWKPAGTLTVAPRIKVIPDHAARGDTVKISLRGFAKKESVRIRWKHEGRWIEIGWVYTSNTGSGELWIPVPSWAEDGQHSVRGDGPGARAQTNAVYVDGGPLIELASEIDEPAETPEPATPEPDPATPAPIESPAEPGVDPTPGHDATPEPVLTGEQAVESDLPAPGT